MESWLQRVLTVESGFERDLVDRYSKRLIELARLKLTDRVRRRVDPEDVVQSVYRSFFTRLKDGRLSFEDSSDLWQLLAAMTYHKSTKAVRFHYQQRRDVRREAHFADQNTSGAGAELPEPSPKSEDVSVMLECAEKLCRQLPEHHRDVFLLRLEGLSVAEIAARVNRSEGTVLRVLARVRTLADKELEEQA